MTKDLEQLRLNMIRTLMEMDEHALNRVKAFLEEEPNNGWKEHISEENVEFIDYSKISKIKDSEKSKTRIVFL